MSISKEFDIGLIRIDDIIISNAVIENNTGLPKLDKTYHYNIQFSFTPGVNYDEKKIRIIFSCEVETFDGADKKIDVKGKFEVAFYFNINNIDRLVSGSKEDIQINADLIASLGNIAYATSRGIIYTKCQGTILKKIILPPLSNEKLVEMLRPAS